MVTKCYIQKEVGRNKEVGWGTHPDYYIFIPSSLFLLVLVLTRLVEKRSGSYMLLGYLQHLHHTTEEASTKIHKGTQSEVIIGNELKILEGENVMFITKFTLQYIPVMCS
jgi:hypothetical protein